MSGTNGETDTQTAVDGGINSDRTAATLNNFGEHVDPTLKIAKDFLAESKGVKLDPAIRTFIDNKVKPFVEKSGELPPGIKPSTGIGQTDLTQAFKDELDRQQTSGVSLEVKPADEADPLKAAGIEISGPTSAQETDGTAIGSDLKLSEQSSTDSDQDLESMLETEKQQKTQEAREAWTNLIKTMRESSIPFFSVSGSKEMLFLIKPTRDPSSPNSEIYITITKDGPKMTQATKETKNMINKLYLNPTEDPAINKLESLEMAPLSANETSDPVGLSIKESQEMVSKITKIREESKKAEESKKHANKLTASLEPQQVSPAPNV